MLQSGADARAGDRRARAKPRPRRSERARCCERIRDLVSVGRLRAAAARPRRRAPEDPGARACESATARGVEIAVESHRPVPLVIADPIGIEQVLNNIVGNAVDAAAERGDGRGRVVMRVIGGVDWAIVQVDDNGRGVSPEWRRACSRPTRHRNPAGWVLGSLSAVKSCGSMPGRISWQPVDA